MGIGEIIWLGIGGLLVWWVSSGIYKAIFNPIVSATLKRNGYAGGWLTLYRKNGKKETYYGDCTCWQSWPDMYDVGTFEESRLHRYWSACKLQGKWNEKTLTYNLNQIE